MNAGALWRRLAGWRWWWSSAVPLPAHQRKVVLQQHGSGLVVANGRRPSCSAGREACWWMWAGRAGSGCWRGGAVAWWCAGQAWRAGVALKPPPSSSSRSSTSPHSLAQAWPLPGGCLVTHAALCHALLKCLAPLPLLQGHALEHYLYLHWLGLCSGCGIVSIRSAMPSCCSISCRCTCVTLSDMPPLPPSLLLQEQQPLSGRAALPYNATTQMPCSGAAPSSCWWVSPMAWCDAESLGDTSGGMAGADQGEHVLYSLRSAMYAAAADVHAAACRCVVCMMLLKVGVWCWLPHRRLPADIVSSLVPCLLM